MKYICINCKEEFDQLPNIKLNECFSGHAHSFVEKKHILSHAERLVIHNRERKEE